MSVIFINMYCTMLNVEINFFLRLYIIVCLQRCNIPSGIFRKDSARYYFLSASLIESQMLNNAWFSQIFILVGIWFIPVSRILMLEMNENTKKTVFSDKFCSTAVIDINWPENLRLQLKYRCLNSFWVGEYENGKGSSICLFANQLNTLVSEPSFC